MPFEANSAQPHWYWIPVRILLVTFLLTLLSFAVSLLLGILGTVIAGWSRNVRPDMTVAYRHVALPTAACMAAVALVAMTVMEVRDFRQSKALTGIARASR
jgi:ABC-type dipeptide/oligopeptide/nickel transport system permease component